MKIKIFVFLALCFICLLRMQAQPAGVWVSTGRQSLVSQNITNANAAFAQALAVSPTHQAANALYAGTRLFCLPYQPAAQAMMDRWGFSATNRNIYHWKSQPTFTDTNDNWILTNDATAAEVVSFFRTNVLPEITGSLSNLAKITDTNFVLSLTSNETAKAAVDIDYGDIQMLRALGHGMEFLGYTIHAYNYNAQIKAIRDLSEQKDFTFERVLRDYPQLLTYATTNDYAAARQAFQDGVDSYLAASEIIRNRPTNAVRLFNWEPAKMENEAKFRQTLVDLKNSWNGPVTLTMVSNRTERVVVNMARLFEGVKPLRSLLPVFRGQGILLGSLPDVTFNGLASSMRLEDIEDFLSKKFEMLANFGPIQYVPSHPSSLNLHVLAKRNYYLEASSDFLTWSFVTNLTSTNGLLTFVDAQSAQMPRRFYRAEVSYAPTNLTYMSVTLNESGRPPIYLWHDANTMYVPGQSPAPYTYSKTGANTGVTHASTVYGQQDITIHFTSPDSGTYTYVLNTPVGSMTGGGTFEQFSYSPPVALPVVLPDSLAGFALQGTVQKATGDFLQFGWDHSPGTPQTLALAFDHQGGLCALTMKYVTGSGSGEVNTTGIIYQYAKQDSIATVILSMGASQIAMSFSLASADSGNFQAEYSSGGRGSMTGQFTLSPMTIQPLKDNEWAADITGSFGGQHHYKITVPTGQKELVIQVALPTDPFGQILELAVNRGLPASPSRHDYLLEPQGDTNMITIRNPVAGDWFILLEDQTEYGGASLRAHFSAVSSASISIDPTHQDMPASSGTNQVHVTATYGASWTATSDVNWIIVTSERNGFGNATVSYSVAANTGAEARYGTVWIDERSLTITQASGVGGGDLAPGSIAAKVVRITDSRGVSTYAPVTFIDDTHFSMPADMFMPALSGTYVYTKTGSAMGDVSMVVTSTPLTGRQITISLVFTSATKGAFTYSATGGGVADYQMSGSFSAE